MSERQIITISDDKLSCEATAILLRMLNFPDTDYHTAEELCPFFENDSLKTIRNLTVTKLMPNETKSGRIEYISHDKYTSNKQIREWLEVDKDTAAKVISALRKAGYIGDEYSNYIIPVNITTEVYFRLRSDNNSKN